MSYSLSFKIHGIDGQFTIPINQSDDFKFVTSLVKKEFGIIPELSAKIYGNDIQSTSIVSQCVRSQDIVTFYAKNKDNLEFYRQPIIMPRYQSKITEGDSARTFIVFTTANYQSLTKGDKIKINIDKDLADTQNNIKQMLSQKYSMNVDSKKIQIFLPGGIPFLTSTISDYIESFPDYMPHLYAIIIINNAITDSVLDETFDQVCNISNPKLVALISPDCSREKSGLCEMAAVLGYIQQNSLNVDRMIYSIAKFCPFAPMICGLYTLSCLSRATGRTILQITSPLILIFKEMSKNLTIDDQNLFSCTVKFLTYFMNIKINDRIPCTEFIRPFYSIGFEKYFKNNYQNGNLSKIECIAAFDPDFRDQDWIRFALPSLKDEDFKLAMEHTNTLCIIPAMSLREMHRVSLFRGSNGPWLFLTASISKEEEEKDKVDFINPEKGEIEHEKYQELAKIAVGVDYKTNPDEFDQKVLETVDPSKVKQLVFICIDKSESMLLPIDRSKRDWAIDLYMKRELINLFGTYEDRFTVSRKFFTKFTDACYTYHNTSLFGSIIFNRTPVVKNKLNPLPDNFNQRMFEGEDKPEGGTRMFDAIKVAADVLLDANKDNKYKNAILRIIVISDGIDQCPSSVIAKNMNFIIENRIRVDGIIVSDEISPELVAASHFTGGVSIFPRSLEEGLDFFNKEEFFNVDIREFGSFHTGGEVTVDDIKNLRNRQYTVNDLDSEIKIKQNEFAKKEREVTSPGWAITEHDKLTEAQKNGQGNGNQKVHPNQKRIISELRKIITNPDEDIRVYPLKDRVDVWRVLIKGFDGSLYENKWFYMIVEFTSEYPTHYPLFRFVKPPFHPNITDTGRICLDSIDQNYRSDRSVRELIGDIRGLLLYPNFDSAVDNRRKKYHGKWVEDSKGAKVLQVDPEFKQEVDRINNQNGKNDPADWEKEWKITADTEEVKNHIQNIQCPTIPDQFLCPINRSIMKEPVKASTGAHYEKVALEKYIRSRTVPTCKLVRDENGKPLLLDKVKDANLPVDNDMKAKIANWIKETNYSRIEEGDDDEEENILDFTKSGAKIENPSYAPNDLIDTNAAVKVDSVDFDEEDQQLKRLRPLLNDA